MLLGAMLPVITIFVTLLFGPLMGIIFTVGAIWLVRSILSYSSVVSSFLDGAITLGALLLGLWAMLESGSFILAVWIFSLASALVVLVQGRIGDPQRDLKTPGEEPFDRVARTAEVALHRLMKV